MATHKTFHVHPKTLLLIAAVVWAIAGVNILRLGILAFFETSASLWLLLLGCLIIFILFHALFSRLVAKHTRRIQGYGETRTHMLKFFDIQSYIIMAVMMTVGISLRAFQLVPTWFIAFFYTGLGAALTLAGIGFFLHYKTPEKPFRCPVTHHISSLDK